jgi:phenylpyruvate tautomerase PptA (4-oxalocrotonate tautomerase family)
MPYYEINHSYPLTTEQREQLAAAITRLHSAAFATPSLFVNVRFIKEDVSDGSFFIAGKRRFENSNRVTAFVRTSPHRTKADFDQLSQRIEQTWYSTIGSGLDGSENAVQLSADGKRLHAIAFLPIVTAREVGLAIPEAGKEEEWFKEQMPTFKKMAESGRSDISAMLQELEERSDLPKVWS